VRLLGLLANSAPVPSSALCYPFYKKLPLHAKDTQISDDKTQGDRQVGFCLFLLVSSLSMMVRIIEHRAETSEDFVMEQEVASSVPRVTDCPDSGTAVVHFVQQHTPAQASRTPSRAAPTALSAARELLRHPLALRHHRGP
jgi:hypothetical protein